MSATLQLAFDALRDSFRDGPFHADVFAIVRERSLYETTSEGLMTYLQSPEGSARLEALELAKGQPAAIAAIVGQGRRMILEALNSKNFRPKASKSAKSF